MHVTLKFNDKIQNNFAVASLFKGQDLSVQLQQYYAANLEKLFNFL